MTSEPASDDGTGSDGSDGAGGADGRTVSVLGVDVVLEDDFVAFPWRAGMRRAPVAFAITFVLVFLVAAIGGFGQGPFADRFALLGVIVYNAHNIHAATGYVPEIAQPLYRTLLDYPPVWRPIRGLFVVGPGHADPLGHLLGIVGGDVGEIGHVNIIEQQGDTDVPGIVYYVLPVVVLVATGYEYALRYWETAATDSPLEVVRFGIAVGLGYLLVLLVGTVAFTVEMGSALANATFLVHPDRYLTVLFGFGYPAVFASLGAALVYLHREVLPEGE